MEKGRDVPGRSVDVSVGPGQLGFTSVDAAKTAEGLRKPEGGPPAREWHSSPHVADASSVTVDLGHPEQSVVGTPKPTRGIPEPSARAGGQQSGESRSAKSQSGGAPRHTLKGSRTSREDPSWAHAREGGPDTEDPGAWDRKVKGTRGEPGAKTGSTWQAPRYSEGDGNLMRGAPRDGDVERHPVEALKPLEGTKVTA
jgi:hypothetical protein